MECLKEGDSGRVVGKEVISLQTWVFLCPDSAKALQAILKLKYMFSLH